MYYNIFSEISHQLKKSEIWRDMVNTTEDSPYHQEKNVAVHTEMVVSEYIALTGIEHVKDWTREIMWGAIAALFHDTGKPYTEETTTTISVTNVAENLKKGSFKNIFKKVKNSYKQHETYSANVFIDFIQNMPMNLLDDLDIYVIHTMITHHRPFYADKKLNQLAYHCKRYNIVNPMIWLVFADLNGRIFQEQEIAKTGSDKVKSWAINFRVKAQKTVLRDPVEFNDCHVFMPVGVSGSGKTTAYNELKKMFPDIQSTSLDSLRLEYHPDYETAFKLANEDENFGAKSVKDYLDKLAKGRVYIDNINITNTYRKRYVNNTRGKPIAVMIYMTHHNRTKEQFIKRTDKFLPIGVFNRQWHERTFPLASEYDAIKFYRGD